MTLQEKLNIIQDVCNKKPLRVSDFDKGQIVYSAGRSYRVTSFDGTVLRVTCLETKAKVIAYKQENNSFKTNPPPYSRPDIYVFDSSIENAKVRLDKGTKAYEMVKLNRELELLTNEIDELYNQVELNYLPKPTEV